MKKNFPMLLLRIGGFLALLGVAAFVLMLVIKLVVTALVLAGIGSLVFKIASHKRRQFLGNNYAMLPGIEEQRFSNSKIQPIFNNSSNKNKTIIPIL